VYEFRKNKSEFNFKHTKNTVNIAMKREDRKSKVLSARGVSVTLVSIGIQTSCTWHWCSLFGWCVIMRFKIINIAMCS